MDRAALDKAVAEIRAVEEAEARRREEAEVRRECLLAFLWDIVEEIDYDIYKEMRYGEDGGPNIEALIAIARRHGYDT